MIYNCAMILEGGANRGIFTAGVLDYLMEQEVYPAYVSGVSAGACNAVDYVSRQPGRTRDCVIALNATKGLKKVGAVVKNRSLIDMDQLFDAFPNKEYPFDYETFFRSEIICELVATNCDTGKAEYFRMEQKHEDLKEDNEFMLKVCRASSSLPIATPIVEIDGHRYLDGGLADSIPIARALELGYRKNVLVLTRQKGYRKSLSKRTASLYNAYFKKYPELARLLCLRHLRYNKVISTIEKWEEEGRIFVIRPEGKVISRLESDEERLLAFYQEGYEQMERRMEELKEFLEG